MIARRDRVNLVLERARGRCEYCQMDQSLQGATFHIEHIVPQSLGGTSDPENLALACPRCNLKKSDRIEAADPLTGEPVRLFNPRHDVWSSHFAWSGFEAVALTAIGRATNELLKLNHQRRLRIRQAEAQFNLFPPKMI